ncbi:hypothetical protein FHS14_000854 [Paenibacillus baekrokdamisoli]|nr:hypothetical protein [Paenibacillus baekrokdamisoli]MBB3067878.1 hypothetical protein [Paenibacillus baekrokdamisoli]
MMVYLLSGCGGNSGKAVTDTPASAGLDPATTNVAENSPQADIMKDAVLGAKLSYFDAKFGAGVKKEDELTVSYLDGKIRVTENQEQAFNIFNSYVDRGEAPSTEEALAFIKQFLPKDAVQVKDEEDATTKIHTYTYTSQALKAQTQLAGQLTIGIYKDPEDESKVRQAQISIDITANM